MEDKLRYLGNSIIFLALLSYSGCTYYSAVATDGKHVFVTRNKGWIWYNGDVLTCEPGVDGLRCVKGLEVAGENNVTPRQTVSNNSSNKPVNSETVVLIAKQPATPSRISDKNIDNNNASNSQSIQPVTTSNAFEQSFDPEIICKRLETVTEFGWQDKIRDSCLSAFRSNTNPDYRYCATNAKTEAQAKDCLKYCRCDYIIYMNKLGK